MYNTKFNNISLIVISIFIGFITHGCVVRLLESLARHGHISWGNIVYPSKIVLVGSSYLAYRYLKNSFNDFDGNIYGVFKKNVAFFILLAIATSLVFSQYSIFQIFIRPIKTLLFRW
jgi:hypothetical protein